MRWGCGRGFCPWGGGGAPLNSWVCNVIQQFALPLAPTEGRVSSAWVFPTTQVWVWALHGLVKILRGGPPL